MPWQPMDRSTLRLYLIADASLANDAQLVHAVSDAIRGGVSIVQLRAKGRPTREQVQLARALVAVCRARRVPFVVNDRVDVALASGADGVHVGHIGIEDLAPDDARRILGPDAIVGVSVQRAEEAREAERLGSSYVSGGPMYATSTKADAGAPIGARLVAELVAATALPVVAIGGIEPGHVRELLAAGACGVCVARGILGANDRELAARAYLANMEVVT